MTFVVRIVLCATLVVTSLIALFPPRSFIDKESDKDRILDPFRFSPRTEAFEMEMRRPGREFLFSEKMYLFKVPDGYFPDGALKPYARLQIDVGHLAAETLLAISLGLAFALAVSIYTTKVKPTESGSSPSREGT